MTVTALAAPVRGAGRHPNRYRLHRAGICNVWQYDDAEFLFGGGRLLLRGKNGAGKSKAMEMLLPFLLDGDTRALDATGTGRTSLRWLMLDGAEVSNRLGYLWLELRRTDSGGDDEYLTLGAAIKASRSTNEAKPLFFLARRRIGHDLLLVDGGQPLSLDRLRAEVGEADVFPVAKDYRARVARDVFGLTDAVRYRNLTHLLHRLRRPTIGDRVESGGLGGVLTEALPPLDEEIIDDVAHNLDDLDAVRAELARLERTDAALAAFGVAYRGYLHGVLRRRVAAVREELESLRVKRRAAGAAERDLDTAEAADTAAAARVEELRAAGRAAETDLRALRDSADYQSLAQLRDRRTAVNALATAAKTARSAAGAAASRLASAGGRLDDDTARIATDVGQLRTDHREALEAALTAGVDAVHLATPPRVAAVPLAPHVRTVDVDALVREAAELGRRITDAIGVIRGRGRLVRQVIDELHRAEAARRAAATAEAEAEQAEDRAEQAAADVTTRMEEVAARSAEFAAAVAAWCARLPRTVRTGSGQAGPEAAGLDAETAMEAETAIDTAEVLAAVVLPDEVSDDPGLTLAGRCLPREVPAEVEQAAENALTGALHACDTARDAAAVVLGALSDQLDEVERERRRVQAERDPAPPRSRFLDHARAPGTGAPLYLLVDFADGTAPAVRAGLEAALEASGLLDAWLQADGRVMDPRTLDTVLRPGAPVSGPSLAQVLLPAVPDPGQTPPVSATTVAALLASIGWEPPGTAPAGAPADRPPAPEPASWIAHDGRWRLGVAAGAYRKPAAEYVGAGVRAATRARRLAELTARLEELSAARQTAQAELAQATARRDELRAARRDLPRGAELDRSWTLQESAVAAASTAQRLSVAARDTARRLTSVAADAHRTAEATAGNAGLPLDATRLDDARHQVDHLLRDVERLRASAARLPGLTTRHPGLLDEYHQARDAAETAAIGATTAEETHEDARRELAEQESAIGASEAELMAREADATGRRDRAGQALPGAMQQARQAVEDKVEARSRRVQAQGALAEQEQAVMRTGQALRTALLLPALPAAAGIELPSAVSDGDLGAEDVRGRLKRLDDLVEAIGSRIGPTRADQTDTQILRRGQELNDALPGGLDAPIGEYDGIKIVEVLDDAGAHPVAVYAARIAGELAQARTRLSDREQEVFRRFLLGELGDNLSRQMISARTLVDDMNRVLADVRSSHGIGVRLVWEVGDTAHADVRAAVELLASPSGLRTAQDSERLRGALQRLIEAERREDPDAGYAAHLRKGLDYRAWFAFDERVTDALGRERKLGPRTGLSQGEQRVVSYLVLFAAAAAHFTSLGQSEPKVPRLILLDDAFAKVDEPTHARLLELLVELDLDFILTSERLWGNAPAVPHLHVYECLRDPVARGVATLHYEWNGHRMRLVT